MREKKEGTNGHAIKRITEEFRYISLVSQNLDACTMSLRITCILILVYGITLMSFETKVYIYSVLYSSSSVFEHGIFITVSTYSRTSMARTPMACLPRLSRTHSCVPREKSHSCRH